MMLRVERILPLSKNAEALQGLQSDELKEAGLADAERLAIADPANVELVNAQRGRLLRHPRRYLGVFAGRQLFGANMIGAIKFNDWRAADELPFTVGEEHEVLAEKVERDEHILDERPLGIFALLVARNHQEKKWTTYFNESDRLAIASTLLEEVHRRYFEREMRIGMQENDPLLPVVAHMGFEASGRFGRPLANIEQELYIRSPGL